LRNYQSGEIVRFEKRGTRQFLEKEKWMIEFEIGAALELRKKKAGAADRVMVVR